MSQVFKPSILTANDLLEGDVVYLAVSGQWTRRLQDARIFTEADSAEAALSAANTKPDILVGAYLATVQPGPNGPAPTHFREAFRARGPSNYSHGKQADGLC